jgi:hypothetical protein
VKGAAPFVDAGQGNFDAAADISPIRALIEQGCDLETARFCPVERSKREHRK